MVEIAVGGGVVIRHLSVLFWCIIAFQPYLRFGLLLCSLGVYGVVLVCDR